MRIEESLRAILSHKGMVIEDFYRRFVDLDADVRQHFDGVDMQQQAAMLTMALMTVEGNYRHTYPATEHYLKVLGHRHHQQGVAPELYPKFRDCLVETLQDFHGDEWDSALEDQWRAAIDKATAAMLEGYARPYIY